MYYKMHIPLTIISHGQQHHAACCYHFVFIQRHQSHSHSSHLNKRFLNKKTKAKLTKIQHINMKKVYRKVSHMEKVTIVSAFYNCTT